MKILYIQRHAKSSWNNPGLADIDRPLNQRGLKNAPLMGQRLSNRENIPQHIVSSPAKRAYSTGRIIAGEIGYDPDKIVINDRIYGAGRETLISLIKDFSDKYESVMIVGHNPDFTNLANELTNSNIYNIPTSGVVIVKFNINTWSEIKPGTGELLDFDYPKKHATL